MRKHNILPVLLKKKHWLFRQTSFQFYSSGKPGDISHLKELYKCLSNVQLEIQKVNNFWNDVKNVIEGLEGKREATGILSDLQMYKEQFQEGVNLA